MLSIIALIFYGIDCFISKSKPQQTQKEHIVVLDYDKEEATWNPSFV